MGRALRISFIIGFTIGCAVLKKFPGLDCMALGCPEGQVCAPESRSCTTPTIPVPLPTPTPTPTPTPIPAPTPTPTPTSEPDAPLDPAMLPPVYPDAEWVTTDVLQNTNLTAVVNSAVQRARDSRPERWAGSCLAQGPTGIDRGFADVSREFHRSGIRAGQATNDANPKADHLYINRPGTEVWEQWHTFSYANGCLTGNPYKGAFRRAGIGDGCGPPDPPSLGGIVVHRRDVRDGWETFDATPVTAEGNREYCDSVGFTNRNSCPARAEKPAWMKEDRLACERRMLKGSAPMFVWTGAERDGGLREGSNGFTFEHRKNSVGSLKVCDAIGENCRPII